jgi:hypothetical protein
LVPGARFCAACGARLDAPNAPEKATSPSEQVQGQYSPDGKWWWNGTQWVSVAAAAAAAAPSELASAAALDAPNSPEKATSPSEQVQAEYSPDGKWWWNGTQWVSVAVAAAVAAPSEVAPAAVQVVAAPNPVASAAVQVDAAPVKRKKGMSPRLAVLALVLVAVFVLGWVLWPYELLISAAGALLAAIAWWNPRGMGKAITRLGAKFNLPGMKPSASGRVAAAALMLNMVLIPGGIGGLGQYVGGQVAIAPSEVPLHGIAFMANPLTGTTVNIYELGSDGKSGTLLGSTTTGTGGGWNLKVWRRPQGALLVETTHGTYVDVISKKLVTAGANDSLKTVLFPGLSFAELTPLTTFAASRTVTLVASGQPVRASWAVAYRAVGRQYNLEASAFAATSPTIANNPQSVQSTTWEQRQQGLILAGLAQEAADLGTSEFALTGAIAADLSDGKSDGKQGATPILLDHGAALSPNAATADLQKGINKVAAAPGFDNHIPAPQISVQPIDIGLNGAGLFPSTNALPAFVDGVGAHAAITAIGGTRPYYCDPPIGEMPSGFSMSNSCILYYDGTSLLGTSTMRIYAPFTVRMSDQSQPHQAVTFDLRITAVQKPPEINVTPGGNCPQATQPCSITVASVKGGTPPYYFTTGNLTGRPPLGMTIDLFKPILRGKPFFAGTYTFGVCAIDLVGGQSCTPVTVVVGNPPVESSVASPIPTRSSGGTWYIHWSCGGSKQCAQVWGGPTGVQASFSNQAACENLRNTWAANGTMQRGGSWCSQSGDPKDAGP